MTLEVGDEDGEIFMNLSGEIPNLFMHEIKSFIHLFKSFIHLFKLFVYQLESFIHIDSQISDISPEKFQYSKTATDNGEK